MAMIESTAIPLSGRECELIMSTSREFTGSDAVEETAH
jgi:hypothetical protein